MDMEPRGSVILNQLKIFFQDLRRLEIKSPLDVYIIFHSNDFNSLHRELTAFYEFTGKLNVEVDTIEQINLQP